MSNWLEQNLPCPCGDSSDAYAINSKGDGHCFSCGKHFFKDDNKEKQELVERQLDVSHEVELDYQFIKYRGIPAAVRERYNVFVGLDKDSNPREVVYRYNQNEINGEEQEPVGKRRILSPDEKGRKRFLTFGEINQVGLFGKHVHDPGSKRSITITEGEEDAQSIDAVLGRDTAGVSVQSASTALRDITKDRDYINSFDKIILWFDNDVAGQEALKKVLNASLFDFQKVFIVGETKFKDANEYLQNDASGDLATVWRAAKRYTPDGIISTFDEIETALNKAKEDAIGTYPFEVLQHNLFGLHRGEVVVFKAAEGIGKTETFRAIEHHLLKTTDKRIGIIHLEEDDGTTIKAIATYELDLPCLLPDMGITNKEIFNGYKRAVGGKEDRVYMHSHFGADDPDVILDNIRFLTTVCGCDFIFLDHITMLVTGHGDDGDERRKLDYISTRLKLMAKEIGFCLCMISHINDDGQTRGSRNITKIANTVIHIDRNKVAEDATERNTTYYTIEKARLGGRTGPGGKVFFDMDTYKMREFSPMDHNPNKGKKELKL